MIKKDLSDDELVNEALAQVDALPIPVSGAVALAIAAVAIADDSTIERVISGVLEEWASRTYAAHRTVDLIIAAREKSVDASVDKAIQRRAMTPSLRLEVLQRDRHKCVSCRASANDSKLHVDHIIPIAKGGKTEIGNLQTLCSDCNLAKAAKIVQFPTSDETADAGVNRNRK